MCTCQFGEAKKNKYQVMMKEECWVKRMDMRIRYEREMTCAKTEMKGFMR